MTIVKLAMRCMAIAIILFTTHSCKKELEESPMSLNSVMDTIRSDSRVTGIMKELADVIEKTYKDNRAYDEANAAIHCGYYQDERVLVRDLLFPTSSDLYKNQRFKSFKVDTGSFKKVFCQIIEKGNYPILSAELRQVFSTRAKYPLAEIEHRAQIPGAIGIISGTDPVAIYFPYSENFPFYKLADSLPSDNKIAILKKPTIVYSDREADATKGRDVYYCATSPDRQCYREVFVDDNYAFANPTHIITVGADRRQPLQPAVPKTELVHRAYHGSSRLVKQMDKLISFSGNGGGSEIKVCRINGYLRRSDEHIDDFAGDVVTLYYTRGEIRKKEWKRVYSVWDPNWNYQDIEQIYAVYEEDNRATKTLEGSLRTTLTIPGKGNKAEGEIGFKIVTNTQDEIITQRKFDRKSYLRDGTNNQGWGFLPDNADFLPGIKDWPIYDGGSIWHFTFPYRIY